MEYDPPGVVNSKPSVPPPSSYTAPNEGLKQPQPVTPAMSPMRQQQPVMMMQQQPVMMVQQPMMIAPPPTLVLTAQAIQFGEYPQLINCPNCRVRMTTKTERDVSNSAWGCGLLLCLFLPGLCCIPCCFMFDYIHRCSSCNAVVGKKYYSM